MTNISSILSDIWKPSPKESASEWCEANVFLPPRASPRPGRYSTAVTPYVKDIIDIMDDPSTEIIVAIFSAQSSKTTMMLMALAYAIGKNPCNAIWMMPSTDMAQSFSETRLEAIIDASPVLKAKKPADRDRYKKLEKHFADMTLNLIGGNSPTQLASRSAGYIFADEIDKLPTNLGREANPVDLLLERMKWFEGRRKAFLSTTPTTKDHMGWGWLEKGTFEKLFWPCPHCEVKFVPTMSMIKWDKQDGMSDDDRSLTAYIECPNCQGKFLERHKRKALKEAEWRQTNMEATKEIRSFHLSEIQSPMTTLPKLVKKYLAAVRQARKGDTSALQNFVNSSLAECWEEGAYGKRKAEDLRQLADSRERGEVPEDANGLVAGIDTQDNGFWYSVYAVGRYKNTWLVQDGFVETFKDLEIVLWDREWKSRSGKPFIVNLAGIDAGGHRMDEVHNWTAYLGTGKVVPLIGRAPMTNPWILRPINDKGVGGQERFTVNVQYYKDALALQLKLNADSPGALRTYSTTSEDYMNQMTAEYRDAKGQWQQPKHQPNHLWDCAVYAKFLADYLKVDTWSDYLDDTPSEDLNSDPTNLGRRDLAPTPW